jgi:hypothetical protein
LFGQFEMTLHHPPMTKKSYKHWQEAVAVALDSINSRFNVVNMPISTTAPIDAKTHV